MPFEMENTSTGNAAKLAVLWRDRGKGGGAPDEFVDAVMRGAYLEMHDGTGLGAVPTRYTGLDKMSIHQAVFRGYDGFFGGADLLAAFNGAVRGDGGLESIADMIVDLRAAMVGRDGATPPTNRPIEGGRLPKGWKGSVFATLEALQSHIERLDEEVAELKADVRRLESRP